MPRYAIIGGTLWGNRGAEAMVVTAIAQVRARVPGAEFLVLSYYPSRDRELNRDAGVTVASGTPKTLLFKHFPFAMLYWLLSRIGLRIPVPAQLRALKECEALLDVSGISFHDGRIAVLIYNVFCIWPALLVGVPVIHLSQARGPFRNPLNRTLSKWFLAACRHVYARGRVTAELMAELKLPADRWSLAPDVAFGFADGNSITDEGTVATQRIVATMAAAWAAGKRVVTFSPSSVVLKKTADAGIPYVEIFANTITRLVADGQQVVLMPNATRAGGEGGRNNDIIVIDQVRTALAGKLDAAGMAQVSVVDFDLNTDRIRDIVRASDLLVTSRFHAMIAALSLATPTLVVGWSHKYQEVLEMFGCQDDAIDFSALDQGLYPAIMTALARRDETSARIAGALPGVMAASVAQFDLLGAPRG